MNRNNPKANIIGVILLVILAVAILIDGKYNPATSEMITIQIDGINNEDIAQKVTELVRKIEGVQSVFVDEKSALCTFRYDSGKIDLKTVENQLASMGIQFRPLEPVRILDIPEKHKKLLSIEIETVAP